MAKINRKVVYPDNDNITAADFLIGTQVTDLNKTKSFSIIAISNFIKNDIGGIVVGGLKVENADIPLYGGSTVYLFETKDDVFHDYGIGEFFVPKYDETEIFDNSGDANYIVDEQVIWGGYKWICDENESNATAVNEFELSEKWVRVEFNEVDYNLVHDVIKYDIESDRIYYRENKDQNIIVRENINSFDRSIKAMQWGKSSTKNIVAESYTELINFNGSGIDNVSFGINSEVRNNYFKGTTSWNNLSLEHSKILNNSLIDSTFWGVFLDSEAQINGNIFNGVSVTRTKLSRYGWLNNNTFTDVEIENIELSGVSSIENSTANGIRIENFNFVNYSKIGSCNILENLNGFLMESSALLFLTINATISRLKMYNSTLSTGTINAALDTCSYENIGRNLASGTISVLEINLYFKDTLPSAETPNTFLVKEGDQVKETPFTTEKITDTEDKRFATEEEKGKLANISVTTNVDLDEINARVIDLDAAVVLKGTWDASTGQFQTGTIKAGYSYINTYASEVIIDGVKFNQNDRLIALVDSPSLTVYAGNWFKADYTDQFLSLDGQTGATTLGGIIALLTEKPTIIDNDLVGGANSESSNASVKWKFSTIASYVLGKLGATLLALTPKSTPVDADTITINDTDASNVLKKLSLSNLWTNYLKVKADLLYQAALTATNFGAFLNSLTPKTTPVDADGLSIVDTADSNKAKFLSFTNLKAFLATYFDSRYKLFVQIEAGISKTLALADVNSRTVFTNASAITLTVPTNAVVAIPIGSKFEITQQGDGVITLSYPGLTVNSNIGYATEKNGTYILTKIGTDTWTFDGTKPNTQSNYTIYVGDITGNDANAVNFNILKPYKTLNAALTAYNNSALANKIEIIEASNSYSISQNIVSDTIGKNVIIYAPINIYGTINITTTGSIDLCTGVGQLQPGLEINAKNMILNISPTGTITCTKWFSFLNLYVKTLTVGVNFDGFRGENGETICETLNISSGRAFRNIHSNLTTGTYLIKVTDNLVFSANGGRLVETVGNGCIIDFKNINNTSGFTLVNLMNPSTGIVYVNHGNITTSYATQNNYILTYGLAWYINYKDNAIIQGKNSIDVNEASITITGNATYSGDYLFVKHNNASVRDITIQGKIIVKKLINSLWKNKIILSNAILNITDELGTVSTPNTPCLEVRLPSIINQTNPASQLITGGANQINTYSKLYSNTTNTTTTTINNINTAL